MKLMNRMIGSFAVVLTLALTPAFANGPYGGSIQDEQIKAEQQAGEARNQVTEEEMAGEAEKKALDKKQKKAKKKAKEKKEQAGEVDLYDFHEKQSGY